MDIKQAAWQHRTDIVELDWKEYCNQKNYDLANSLGSTQARKNTRPQWTPGDWMRAAVIALAVAVLLWF